MNGKGSRQNHGRVQPQQNNAENQRNGAAQHMAQNGAVRNQDPGRQNQQQAPRPQVQPNGLPQNLQRQMNGQPDLANVRVHQGGQQQQQNAHAFAQGNQIHLGNGQNHMGHEVGHVVQQAQGRIGPNGLANGQIHDDPALERQADLMGARANGRNQNE